MKAKVQNSQRSFPRESRLSNRTIRAFLADDSPLLMAWLARILSKDKRVSIVGSAADGAKAFYNASTLQPDLVITDLHMPGLDGAEVARRLKQLPNPPIIFVVTSDDTPEARTRCMAAGANAFFIRDRNLMPQLLGAIQEFFPDELEHHNSETKHLHETLATVE